MNELVEIEPATPATTPAVAADYRQLLADFYASHKATTLRAYRQALDDFARFLGALSVNEAARILLHSDPGRANQIVLQYRADLVQRDMAASTVNARLSAIRSLVKLSRTLGFTACSVEIKNVKAETYRDTRGPGQNGVQGILKQAAAHRSAAHAARDVAIVRLLYDLGLRRESAVTLDVEHIDLKAATVVVQVKGRDGREIRTLPPQTINALQNWLKHRGADPGPMFTNFDHAGKGRRLTGRSIHRIVKQHGHSVGIDTRPHGLRHTAITVALDATNGDVRAVQRFSGHRDIRVLQRYDDNRQDLAGQVACKVADSA